MGLTRAQLNDILKANATASVDQVKGAQARRQESSENELNRVLTEEQGQAQRDAALANLIKGREMDEAAKNEMLTRQIDEAERMRGVYGSDVPVNVEGVSIGTRDPLAGLKALVTKRELSTPKLTPAQETSEKESGKKLSAYQVSGGSAAMQKNIDNQKTVLKELKTGKRDWYDRKVGGTLSAVPLVGSSLMSLLAPTEKARMDAAQGAALGNIKATDSNPTQVLIDQTLSRAYDPRAGDSQNITRLETDSAAAQAIKGQMEEAANNLASTGYAMPGLAGQAPAQPPAYPRAKPDFSGMSTEQMRQMLKQLREGQ